MKNFFVLIILFILLSINNNLVKAAKIHEHDSQGMEQVMYHFVLNQFNDK